VGPTSKAEKRKKRKKKEEEKKKKKARKLPSTLCTIQKPQPLITERVVVTVAITTNCM